MVVGREIPSSGVSESTLETPRQAPKTLIQKREQRVDLAEINVNEGIELEYSGKRSELAGSFDQVTWNIYLLMQKYRLSKKQSWQKARLDAMAIANSLASETRDGLADTNTLRFLNQLGQRQMLAKVSITPPAMVSFMGKDGAVFASLDLHNVRQRTAEAEVGIPKNPIKKIKPKLGPEAVLPRNFSESTPGILRAILNSRRAPLLISDLMRSKAVCSTYVVQLLNQEFGRETLNRIGLINNGQITDAWGYREIANKFKGLEESKAEGTEVNPDKGLFVKNQSRYLNSVESIFEQIDAQNGKPTILSIFHKSTHYWSNIYKDNLLKKVEDRSYNSHVAIALGREDVQVTKISIRTSLADALLNIGIKPSFAPMARVKIRRKNGQLISVNGNSDPSKIFLESGDQIEKQDILFTDFFASQTTGSEERIKGLAQYLSNDKNLLVGNFSFKAESANLNTKIEPSSFIQLQSADFINEIKDRLYFDDYQYDLYTTYLEYVGKDLTKIKASTLLPVYDISEVESFINTQGGLTKFKLQILANNVDKANAENIEGKFILIESGRSPLATFLPYFDKVFTGKNKLSNKDQALFLRLISDSSPLIDLFPDDNNKLIFEAGTVVFLSRKQITDIAATVRNYQEQTFAKDDYTDLVPDMSADNSGLTVEVIVEGFIAKSFNDLTGQSGLNYSQLDQIEKSALKSILDESSPEIDLQLVKTSNGAFNYGNFMAGARMIMPRSKLVEFIQLVILKRKSQANSNVEKLTYLKAQDGIQKRSMAEIDLPTEVSREINKIYPSASFQDSVINNALKLVWLGEQGRGSNRAYLKSVASVFGMTKSIGPMQIRPTKIDMQNAKPKLNSLGIDMPEDLDSWLEHDFRDEVEDNLLVSLVVAGERLRSNLKIFENFMLANGEDPMMEILNPEFAIMLITSYNRSSARVLDAVYQNWANIIGEKFGLESTYPSGLIDVSLKNHSNKELRSKVELVFAEFAQKLLAEGKLPDNYNSELVDQDLGLLYTNRLQFLRSGLFRAMKGQIDLKFCFEKSEITKGNHIFDYGVKVLPEDHFWSDMFVDYEKMRSSIAAIKESNSPVYGPVRGVDSSEIDLLLNKKEHNDQTVSRIIGQMNEDTDLVSHALEMNLQYLPNGKSVSIVKIGEKLKLIDIVENLGETWLKVTVASGPNAGQVGYVRYIPEYFEDRAKQQTLERLELLMANVKRKGGELPSDYRQQINHYINVKSTGDKDLITIGNRLLVNKPTAIEVTDARIKAKINQQMTNSDSDIQCLIIKEENKELASQRLFLRDNTGKVYSFIVSVGNLAAGEYRNNLIDSSSANLAKLTRVSSILDLNLTNSSSNKLGISGTNSAEKIGFKNNSTQTLLSNIDLIYLAGLVNGKSMSVTVLDQPRSTVASR
jgi:hypothetical protein